MLSYIFRDIRREYLKISQDAVTNMRIIDHCYISHDHSHISLISFCLILLIN